MFYLTSPLGPLAIHCQNRQLQQIIFTSKAKNNSLTLNDCEQNIATELQTYFHNPHHTFTIPLNIIGTAFQQRVWQALLQIPVGTTKTYGALAKELATSARAIGNACRRNPMPIIIPCHRVVAANNVGGFSGQTSGKMLDIKQWLLNHEGISVDIPASCLSEA